MIEEARLPNVFDYLGTQMSNSAFANDDLAGIAVRILSGNNLFGILTSFLIEAFIYQLS
jgi:hypothetical protein